MTASPPESTFKTELSAWQHATRLYDEIIQRGRELSDLELTQLPDTVRSALDSLRDADQRAAQESWLEGPVDLPSFARDPDRLTGTVLGPYQLTEFLNAGGTGVVYRAQRMAGFDQDVAVKILDAPPCRGDAVSRFVSEREALARLEHPHICRLLDAGEMPTGIPYLVMELVKGGPIDQFCDSNRLGIRERVKHFADICEAVSFAHKHRILHRDLKPSNVLMDAHGRVRVTDFGLAKFIGNSPDKTSRHTMTGEVLGTPGYMSPEQALGKGDTISETTDVYGLGAILYALLVGRPPFRSDSIAGTILMVRDQPPLSPKLLDPDISRDLETICLHCLEKNPAHRYSTVEELHQDVDHFLAGQPISARPIGPAERTIRWCRRYPAISGLTIALLVVTLTALTTLIFLLVTAHQDRQEARMQRNRARAAVDEMYTEVSGWLAAYPRSTEVRQRLLGTARKYYEEFVRERSDDPDLLKEAATAWYRLGKIEGMLGNKVGRERAAREALWRFEMLARQFPDQEDFRFDIFHCHYLLHEIPKAFEVIRKLMLESDDSDGIYRDAFVSMAMMMADRHFAGDIELAEDYARQGWEVHRSLQRSFPDDPGNFSRAHKIHYVLAGLATLNSDFQKANLELKSATTTLQQWMHLNPDEYVLKRELQRYYELRATIAWHQNELQIAVEAVGAAEGVAEELVDFFQTALSLDKLRRARRYRLVLETARSGPDEAEELCRGYLRLLENNVAQFPQDAQANIRLALFLVECEYPLIRDRDRARKIVESMDPEDLTMPVLLDIVRFHLGNRRPLLQHLESKKSLSGLNYAYLCLIQAQSGDFADARQTKALAEAAPPSIYLLNDWRKKQLLEEANTILSSTGE